MHYKEDLLKEIHKCSIEHNLRKEIIVAIIENYYRGAVEKAEEEFNGNFHTLPNIRIPILGKLVISKRKRDYLNDLRDKTRNGGGEPGKSGKD